MQFSLLHNGADSIKNTSEILADHYENEEFENFQIKDAVFSFVHGVEILSKYIISSENPAAVFNDPSEYNEAFSKVDGASFRNVFDVNPNLKTKSVMNAIGRLKASWHLPDNLYREIIKIISFRNELMHYTVDLKDEDVTIFTDSLRRTFAEVVEYFKLQIPEFEVVFDELSREEPVTEYDRHQDALADHAIDSWKEGKWEAPWEE